MTSQYTQIIEERQHGESIDYDRLAATVGDRTAQRLVTALDRRLRRIYTEHIDKPVPNEAEIEMIKEEIENTTPSMKEVRQIYRIFETGQTLPNIGLGYHEAVKAYLEDEGMTSPVHPYNVPIEERGNLYLRESTLLETVASHIGSKGTATRVANMVDARDPDVTAADLKQQYRSEYYHPVDNPTDFSPKVGGKTMWTAATYLKELGLIDEPGWLAQHEAINEELPQVDPGTDELSVDEHAIVSYRENESIVSDWMGVIGQEKAADEILYTQLTGNRMRREPSVGSPVETYDRLDPFDIVTYNKKT